MTEHLQQIVLNVHNKPKQSETTWPKPAAFENTSNTAAKKYLQID